MEEKLLAWLWKQARINNDLRQNRLLDKPWVRLTIVLGVFLAVVVFIVYMRLGLRWYLSPTGELSFTQRKDLVQGLASVVQALALLVAGVVGLGGLYFTWRNLNQTRQLTEQGQITERFTRAIDQLGATDDDGNPRLEIRLGGIYALERIDKESRERVYHSTVMEVLTAYIRENAPWPHKASKSSEGDFMNWASSRIQRLLHAVESAKQDEGNEQSTEPAKRTPSTDIQAILDVLKRREEGLVLEHHVILDLRETNLQETNLQEVNLQGASLYRANLRGALLYQSNLRGAILREAILQTAFLYQADLQTADLQTADLQTANLREANLREANLQGADLREANLRKANLRKANLRGADLREADLQGADLREANLREADLQEASNLAQVQIEGAFGSDSTMLPDSLRPPAAWSMDIEEQMRILEVPFPQFE